MYRSISTKQNYFTSKVTFNKNNNKRIVAKQ